MAFLKKQGKCEALVKKNEVLSMFWLPAAVRVKIDRAREQNIWGQIDGAV